MWLTDIAKDLGSMAKTASIGGRTLLGLDTNPVPSGWTHITKVDPETEKKLPLAFPLYLSHSSAVSVGGSQDVTPQNTEETFELITNTEVPAFHEPSAPAHITHRTWRLADFVAIPEVLNGENKALVGDLGCALEKIRTDLCPTFFEEKLGISLNVDGFLGRRITDFAAGYLLEKAVFEAYIIMNLDSAAAEAANVSEKDLLTPQEAKERSLAAQYHLESEVIYLEYSGTFGGDEAVSFLESIDDGVSWSKLWYGGGLDDRENVRAVLDAGADAVVVGNVFHDIAAEEAALFEQAREEFDSVPEDLTEWVADTVDAGETAAARYLSTTTEVPNPERRAVRYLTTGIEFALHVDALAAELSEPDAATIEGKLRLALTGDHPFGAALDGDSELAYRLAAGLLADRFDVAIEETNGGEHLGVEL